MLCLACLLACCRLCSCSFLEAFEVVLRCIDRRCSKFPDGLLSWLETKAVSSVLMSTYMHLKVRPEAQGKLQIDPKSSSWRVSSTQLPYTVMIIQMIFR